MGYGARTLWGSALAAFAPFSAAAAASVALNWDDCNSSSTDKSFTGAAVYRQVVSGFGFSAPVRGFSIRIRVTMSNVYNIPYEPPATAWRFDPAGCNAGHASTGAVMHSCPGLGQGATVDVAYDGSAVRVTLSASHDAVVLDPNAQYVLAEIAYDHSLSAAGPQDPAVACGGAEWPACFVIEDAVWLDAQNAAHPMNFEPFWGVSWQDPGGGHCFGDLPVQAVPWTAVKRLYD